MSLEKLIAEAINENPLEVKEIFEAEMQARVLAALEERYKNALSEDEDLTVKQTTSSVLLANILLSLFKP